MVVKTLPFEIKCDKDWNSAKICARQSTKILLNDKSKCNYLGLLGFWDDFNFSHIVGSRKTYKEIVLRLMFLNKRIPGFIVINWVYYVFTSNKHYQQLDY